jgi:hypothetical protein
MKKITQILCLGILFLFVTTLSLFAQKCKYKYNQIDPITGNVTKGVLFNLKLFWEIGFCKIGEAYHLKMEIDPWGALKDNLLKGDPFIFKLSNGEVITINAQEEIKPIWEVYRTIYKGKYDIDVASLQKIAENPPTFIRLNIGSNEYEQVISATDGKKYLMRQDASYNKMNHSLTEATPN